MDNPSKLSEIEIAREALRRLALGKLPPTPDNYRAMYGEISGVREITPFPERELKALHSSLPRTTPLQIRHAREMGSAIAKRSWDELLDVFGKILQPSDQDAADWCGLLRELLQQIETHHAGMTAAQKREAVEHVLASSITPELLYERLQSLLRSWARNPAADGERLTEPVTAAEPALVSAGRTAAAPMTPASPPVSPPAEPARGLSAPAASAGRGTTGELQEIVVQLLEGVLATLLRDNPQLLRETTEIAAGVRAAVTPEQFGNVADRLRKLSYRMHFVAEDQAEIRMALLHLVQLIVDNINELVVDDRWLSGQIGVVRNLMQQPLDLRRLDEIERCMKDVIVKQSSLKHSLNESKDRLKQMLATFVDRLAYFSETTDDYHSKIEQCAEKISKANDIADLTEVLDEVMHETRAIQLDTARSRDELNLMRQRVAEAEEDVTRLQSELAHASEMVRHDALTGALNRKGLDEALEKEIARQRRLSGVLSVALLDVDNFKKLNDQLGHAAGDEALRHLTRVVKEALRPQDVLARYGGEEFVVLLPDTTVADAVVAMTRIQRELTRNIFMFDHSKILVTFSCGVAEVGIEEAPEAAIARADAAMYLAKRRGKNRVCAA